jgi:hypothetical protein
MSTIPSKGPYSFKEVLEKLAIAGHTQLWLSSSNGKEGGNLLNNASGGLNQESVWVMPIIMNRDGFTVAERRGGIYDWYLCGNWKSMGLRAGSFPPDGYLLETELHIVNEKAVILDAIKVPEEPEAPVKKRRIPPVQKPRL